MKLVAALAMSACLAAPAAGAQQEAQPAPRQSLGSEIFYSSDSDDTETVKVAVDFDIRSEGDDDHRGVRVEKAWFNPGGADWTSRQRVYLRAADNAGRWQWRARIGTDGDSVIGAIAVNDDAPARKEFFVERDIVETRKGLERGLYTTFAGAAIDLPADDRNVFTALVAVQEFSGDNARLHVRGGYVHVVKPDWGLSAQLRGRYFRNSRPYELDYYSPRWYAEILPVAQVRRFVGGWEVVGAAGLGLQRDSASGWRESSYAHARFRSPAGKAGWAAHGAFTYTNTPPITGTSDSAYRYMQLTVGLSRRF